MVSINWTIFWEVINFLLLLWLLKRYLFGPVTEILNKRAESIENELDSAETARKEAKELKEHYEAELKKARQKAQEIIEEAEVRGKRQAKEIVAEARQEAEKIKEGKLQEISQAKKEALIELRKEVSSISLLIAGKLLQEKMDRNQHEALISRYIQDLDKQKLGELQ